MASEGASAYSAQLESKLKAMTLSPSAAHWVAKALHPVVGAPALIPDAIQVTSLLPEYRNTAVIGAPAGLGAGLNWDCCFIFPPSDTQAAFYTSGASGIDFATTIGLAAGHVVNAPVGVSGANNISTIPVVLATGVVGPNFPVRAAYSFEHPVCWRTSSRSATVYATGADLYNQGTVYGGQYARKVSAIPGLGFTAVAPGAPTAIMGLDVVNVPLRETDLAVQTPNLYTTSAREGVYTVHRLTGPSQEFVTRRGFGTARDSTLTSLLIDATDSTSRCSLTAQGIRFAQDDPEFISPILPPVDETWLSSGWDDHCTWGVVIFRGLHPQMSLTLKTVVVLELVPEVAAPSRQFVVPPAKYEPTAMAAYYALASEVPTTMAAKYNFLSALLPVLAGVASKVLPFLAPAAHALVNGLGGALGGALDRASQPEPQREVRTVVRNPPPTPRRVRTRSVSTSRSGRQVKIKVSRRKRR